METVNEKDALTALVIAVMIKTSERVGNEDSADKGHYGVTCFRKKHVKIEGNKVILKYIGKSGVKHENSFTDETIANALKKAIQNSPNRYVFCTSNGFRIKASRVNEFLGQYNITCKDIRGHNANRWILDKLKNVEPDEKESKRKRQLSKIVKSVAEKIGHGRATLRNHYMIPELEYEFVEHGKVIDIKELGYYSSGGELKAKSKTLTKYLKGGEVKEDKKTTNLPTYEEIYNKAKDSYSSEEIQKVIGRKLHWWNDDKIYLDGVTYKKAFLRNEYIKI
jgi:DNA topoisomerase-1